MWRKYAGAGVLVLAGLSTVPLLQAQDTDGDAKPRTPFFKKLRQSVGLGGGEETPPAADAPISAPVNPGGSPPANTAPRTSVPGQRPVPGAPGVGPGGPASANPANGANPANATRGSGLPNYNGPPSAGTGNLGTPTPGASASKGPAGPPMSSAYAPGGPGASRPGTPGPNPNTALPSGVGPTPGATPPANPFRDPPAMARKAPPTNVEAGNPFSSRPAEVGISDTPAGAAASQYPPAGRIPAAPPRQTEFTAKRDDNYRPASGTVPAGSATAGASAVASSPAGSAGVSGGATQPARTGYPPESSPYSGVSPRTDAAYPGVGYPNNSPTAGTPANRPIPPASKPPVSGSVVGSSASGNESGYSLSPVEREPARGAPLNSSTGGPPPAASPMAGSNPSNNNSTSPMASPFDERTFRVGDGRPEGSPFASRPAAERPAVERPAVERPTVERLTAEKPPVEKTEIVREPVRAPVETARTSDAGIPGRAALTPKAETRPVPVETRHVVAPPKPPVETRHEEPRSVVVAPSHNIDPEHPVVRGASAQDSVLLTGQSPVLSVETTGPRKIVIGKSANYTIMVKNSSTVAARDVVVSIKVPEWAEVIGMEAKSRDVEKPSNTSDGVQWTLRRLKGKGEEELTLKVVPRQGLPFDLSIEVSHAPVLTQASVEVQEPKLMMALTGPGEVMYGKQEIYKLTLSNPGTGDAEAVELTLLPTNPGDPTPAPHRIGGLKAGESKVIELELTARQGGTLKINAVATAAGGLKTTIDESILVRKAALIVAVQGSKFRYAGTESSYEIQVTNPGNATAQNVQLHAMLPPGAKFVSATNRGRYDAENGRVVWQLSNMAPAAEQNVSWTCELTEAGLTRIQAACSADNELRNSAAFLTDVEAVADLALSVTDPRGPLPVGHEMVYEVTIENRGTKAAEGVEIIGSFSEGVEATSASGGPTFEIKTGQICFAPITVIEPGQSLTLKVHAKASTPGNHVFRAELICDAIETRIAKEESTRFFGDEPRVEHTAEKAGGSKAPRR